MNEEGWCLCGMAWNDPAHDGWHKLWDWNRSVFARARQEAGASFRAKLEHHDYLHGRQRPDPQTDLGIVLEPTANTYSR